jgi:hypothetical protein
MALLEPKNLIPSFGNLSAVHDVSLAVMPEVNSERSKVRRVLSLGQKPQFKTWPCFFEESYTLQ